MTRRAIALAVILAGAVAAPPADARTQRGKARLLTRNAGPAMTDGSRYAAFDRPGAMTRVYDTRRKIAYDVARPTGFGLAAVGGGLLLWTGPSFGGRPVQSALLFDLRTHARIVPAGLQPLADDKDYSSVAWSGVGRYGLAGRASGYHYSYGVLLNWRTGAHSYSLGSPPRPDVVEDLDKPGLFTRLCDPLRRAVRYPPQGAYFPFSYDRPFGLTRAGRNGQRLELLRCGSRHPRTLAGKCPFPCPNSLGGGVVSWLEHRRIGRGRAVLQKTRVFAFRMRSERRQSWGPLTGRTIPRVAHTSRDVFVSTIGRHGLLGTDPYPFTVRVARIR